MPAQIRMAAEAAQMLATYSPVVVERLISFEYEPPSLAEFRGRVRTTLERMPWLLCDHAVATITIPNAASIALHERWACDALARTKQWLQARPVAGRSGLAG